MTPKPILPKQPLSLILAAAFMLLFAALPRLAFAQSGGGRLHVVSHVDVLPKFAAETSRALQEYAADSRKDPGAIRIDVLRESAGANHFTLIEVWESRAAFDEHIGQEHTKAFREKLHAWLGSPYDQRMNEEVK